MESKIEINKEYVQELLVRKALEYLGTPYCYGGANREGVDCSGLVYGVYREAADKKLPRVTSELFHSLPPVTGPLLPGDLVFFDTTGGISHVGMSIGGSRIVHAASRGPTTGVIISSLEEEYYRTRYLGARRVFQYTAPVLYVTLGAARIMTELSAPLPAGRTFTLQVDHRRLGGKRATARFFRRNGEVIRRDNGTEHELKKMVFSPGKEKRVECAFAEPGDWVISFSEDKTGEILRIEVRVERDYEAAGKQSGGYSGEYSGKSSGKSSGKPSGRSSGGKKP